mgnify:CR=1 FL=1|tara:strand:+ start:19982 stop:23296 length:3315 start_codon:yes stop_codon:yes gene_type:complete
MPVSQSKKLCPGYQPIDGYTLEERIGCGGFGEVWRADAPGGIKKAVKFVFGDHQDHRAERELKSLERIKGVQHPFLLALERFEIVDGQLVIVTELADGSLEDIFKQHRDRGSCGIPRNGLLTYMHDAADALDYLHEMYQLQHLDVKPANLLMVGGHVKVADFGLIKDLREVDCSIIGGLTPIYAPPEVFDGRPSMNSDQYSLAVMYQELLTGVRPFSGRTIAQLATQHVHNAPNLDPLPSCDQPVIARALEKNPDRRYSNCREFVEDLRDPHRRSSDKDRVATTTGAVNLTSGLEPNEVKDLPQIDGKDSGSAKNGQAVACTPVLVLALGGMGAQCVKRLRQQIAVAADTPISLHAVTIDTDTTSLRELRTGEPTKGTPVCQTLHTPLRSAQEYRTRGTEHLRSISRRWIYNVPRSGQTEGMRPLGRMALVDHASEVELAIREVAQMVANASNTVAPNVFVIGSTSGGTASGMYMDAVHLLRDALDQSGLESTKITSLLIAPAMRSDPRRPLTLHDTIATLTEIKHFMKPGNGYPGDPGANWNTIPASRTPLRDAYVISASTEPGMLNPIQSACEYIWLHGTGANELLSSARLAPDTADNASIETSTVRSVGVIQLTGTRTRDQRLLAATAARQLFLQWIGNPVDARTASIAVAERIKRRARISLADFVDPIIQSMGDDRNSRRAKLMMHLRSLPVEQLRDPQACRDRLTEFISDQCEIRDTNNILRELADTLQRELSVRLHDRGSDLSTAIESVRLLSANLKAELEHALNSQEDSADHLETSPSELTSSEQDWGDSGEQQSSSNLIGTLRSATTMGEELIRIFADHYGRTQATALVDVLGRLEDRLRDGAGKVAQGVRACEKGLRGSNDPWTSISAETRDRLSPHFAEVHGRLAHRWLIRLLSDAAATVDPIDMSACVINEFEVLIAEDSKLSVKENRRSDVPASVSHTISGKTATGEIGRSTILGRDAISNHGDSMTLTSALSDINQDPENPIVIRPPTVEDAITVVRPPLLDCGGSQRLILIVGSEDEKSQYESSVRQAHHGELTVCVVPGCIPTLVHEAQQIAIDEIIKRLEAITIGQSEISRRLLSRCDVDWQGALTST